MSASNAQLDSLSDAQRQLVESLLVDFEHSWDEGRLASSAQQLPADADLRRPLLVEMIKIDLECRWRRGQRRLLEDYLRDFSELGRSDALSADLIQAEYEVRQQFGNAPELPEYSSRFPQQAKVLEQLVNTDPGSYSTALASVSPSGSGPALPERFGRYRILRKLGQGGMGAVYLAEDTQLDRRVALKVPSLDVDRELRERFVREARAAATLSHPHLCPVYDAGEIDGLSFLTMAYIEGQPLSETMKTRKAPPAKAVELVKYIAQAMAEAHAHGVIHRDLKPANIMIKPNGDPVIMDFGLARRMDKGDVRVTQTGSLLGTPAYMSPEQWAGDAARIGPASDLYSLGVIFYQLLTGRLPFAGDTFGAMMTKALTETPDPPSTLRPGLDPRLDVVCLKAIRRDPADRYASMTEFAAALPDLALPSKRAGRRALLAVIAAAILAAFAFLRFRNGSAAKTSATSPASADTKAAPQPFQAGPVWSLPAAKESLTAVALSHDGRHVLTASEILFRGWLHIWDAASGQIVAGKSKEFLWNKLIFSSDGRRFLAVAGAQYSILADVETHQELRRFDTSPGVEAAAFSADGSHVIMKLGALKKDVIAVWSARMTEPFEYRQHPDAHAVALSSDGGLAFSASKDLSCVWDTTSGQERFRIAGGFPFRCAAFAPAGGHLAVGSADGAVVIVDTTSGKETHRCEKGHTGPVVLLTYSPDSKVVLSGSEDRTARLWDAATGKQLQELPGHTAPVITGAFSLDGKQLVTGSWDSNIRVWKRE